MTASTPHGPQSPSEGTLETTGRVGQFAVAIVVAEPSDEVEERWAQRAEALAQWLLAEWRRQQAEPEE